MADNNSLKNAVDGIAAGAKAGAGKKRRPRVEMQPYSMIPEMTDDEWKAYEYKAYNTDKKAPVKLRPRGIS